MWYATLWLSIVPGLLVWRWLGTMKPGAGPQGGLVAFAGLAMTLLTLTLLGFVLAISFARASGSAGVARYALVLGVWLVGWGVMAWGISSTANRASLADASPAERVRARGMYLLLLAASVVGGLYTLLRLRAAQG